MNFHLLNKIGQAAVTAKILSICSQHDGIVPSAFFEDAEDAMNNTNGAHTHFEVSWQYTDSKNPVLVDVSAEWFDCYAVDE